SVGSLVLTSKANQIGGPTWSRTLRFGTLLRIEEERQGRTGTVRFKPHRLRVKRLVTDNLLGRQARGRRLPCAPDKARAHLLRACRTSRVDISNKSRTGSRGLGHPVPYRG